MPIIILVLGAAVCITFALAVVVFFDVAFGKDRRSKIGLPNLAPAAGADAPSYSLRPPRPSGKAQKTRAALEANETACRLGPELPSPIWITPPEALGIASYLRTTRSPSDCSAIEERARRNIADRVPACPLLEPDGTCAAFSARPIWCHTCALCQSREEIAGLPATEAAEARQERQSMERGLSEGLRIAELDGNQYEINSVLAIAMSNPQAAQQWSRGAKVFEACQSG